LVTDATSCGAEPSYGGKYASITTKWRTMVKLCTFRCPASILSTTAASSAELIPCASGDEVRHCEVGQ
jgi:hypothetical protein